MVNKKIIYLSALLMMTAVVGITFSFYGEFTLLWESLKKGELHPFYLIGGFFILPIFGFPVSPLLVVMGVRFGFFAGLALVLAIIPFHLAAAFWISHSVLHKHFQNFLNLRSVTVPTLPEGHRLKYSILFMALPGLAYSIKNYILPLSGLPFFHFMLCGWIAQGLLAVPFVVFGGAASRWGVYLFPALAVLIIALLAFGNWVRSAYRQNLDITGTPGTEERSGYNEQ